MAETVLSVEEHFEALRESVWVRFCARHRSSDRDRFDDLYAEWWTREVERAAKGSPSRAAAPAAFIAEAVHRVLIDDARARARGLARDAKRSLELVDIDDQLAAASPDDTAASATYEALVHRVLSLVQGRLTQRELRVFVWSYLYLQPAEAAANALGLSVPRVKKDRRKIATKIGAEVWGALSGELDLCAVYDEKSLPAVFEILTIHVEDCPVCSDSLGKVRRGALVIVGPEMLLVGSIGAEGVTHGLSDLVTRLNLWLHRGTETLTALPPQGRTAAAVAVAATAVAGGAATVPGVVKPSREAPKHERKAEERTPKRVAARPTATVSPPAAAQPSPTRRTAAKVATKPRRKSSKRKATATVRATATAVPTTGTNQQEFEPLESATAAPAPPPASAPPPTTPPASVASGTSGGSSGQVQEEFGLESSP